MKLTKNRIDVIIKRHNDLMEWIDSFISEKTNGIGSHSNSRINYGTIEKYVNTSCHCHPQMEWIDVGTMDEFVEWVLVKQQ